MVIRKSRFLVVLASVMFPIIAAAGAGPDPLNVDQSQLLWNTGLNLQANPTTHFIGQTFTQGAGLNFLNSIEIRWFDYPTAPGTVTSDLELHNATGGTYDATSLIATATTTASGPWDFGDPGEFISWDFGDVAVTPGNQYAFIMKHTSGVWGPALFNSPGPYAGGNLLNNNGAGNVYTNVAIQDLTFQTHSSATLTNPIIGALDQANTEVNTGFSVGVGEIMGQSFTQGAGLNYLTAIEIRYYGWETLPLTATLELRESTGGNPEGGALLASVTKTFTGPFTYTDPETWLRWDFPDIAVTPGRQYTFLYRPTVGAMGAAYNNSGQFPWMDDVYAGGSLMTSWDGGAFYNQYFGWDMGFKTYASSESSIAHTPYPADGATYIDQNINLQWLAAGDAVTYEVYFDSDQANVVNRSVTPVIVTAPANSTALPISLEMETAYFWAVDSIDSIAQLHSSPVWQFNTRQRPAPTLVGDLNLDLSVDWKDGALFSSQWLDATGNWDLTNADLDGVNGVGEGDATLLAQNWLETGIPLGFSVLGSVVPPEYENPSLYSFSEVFPITNTTPLNASPEQLARGYVTYVKNYLDSIYPRTTPQVSEVTNQLTMFAATGEYEPVTFTIHALPGNDLTDVSVSVDDLTGPAGSQITSRNIDVRSVRCWPKKVWDDTLLYYETKPWFLERRATLDIDSNTSQRYWITVYVPVEAAPGIYSGTVTVEVASHDNYLLSLSLEVPDIQLMTSPSRQGMYYSIMGSHFPPFEHAYYPEAYYYQELMNMKEHGMNTAYVFNPEFEGYVDGNGDVIYNLDPIAPFVDAAELAGFDSVIWNMTIGPILPDFGGPSPTRGKNYKGFVDAYIAKGWSLPTLSHGDETDVRTAFYQQALDDLAASKFYVPAVKTYTSIVYPIHSEWFEPDLDIRVFSSYMDNTATAPTQAAGRELWMYSGADRGTKINRLNRGFFAAAVELDGMMAWTYFTMTNPYLPFDDLGAHVLIPGNTGSNHRGCVLPGLGGPLPTPDWEGFREGVEDRNYTFTLETLITQANASGDANLLTLASNAQSYLDSLIAQIHTGPLPPPNPFDPDLAFPVNYAAGLLSVDFFDNARVGMAGHIKAISDALAVLP
jgi:hypothetical protein